MPKHMNTTTCCSHEFTPTDIKPPLMTQRQALGTNDPKLYGGNAKWFARAVCPDCEQPRLLWLMPVPRGYKVLTISVIEEPVAADANDERVQDEGDPIDVETADRDQLRAYLKQQGVSFFNGAGEDQLRELARGTLAVR